MQRYVFFLNLQALRRFFFEKKVFAKPLGSSFLFPEKKKRNKENSPATFLKLFRSSREGFSFLFHEEKKRSKENSSAALPKLLSLKPRGLFISFSRKKETKQRKFAGYVPEAKICTFFLKKKNSFHSNSFFFLTEKRTNFFTLLHSCRKLLGWMVTKRCFARFLGALRMVAECASLVFWVLCGCLQNVTSIFWGCTQILRHFVPQDDKCTSNERTRKH